MANHGLHSQASVLSSGGLPFQPDPLHLLRKSWTPSKQVSRCTKGPGGNRRAKLFGRFHCSTLRCHSNMGWEIPNHWIGLNFKWGNSSDWTGVVPATHITRVLIVVSVKAYYGRFFGEIFVNKLDPHSIVKLHLDGSCGMYTRFFSYSSAVADMDPLMIIDHFVLLNI